MLKSEEENKYCRQPQAATIVILLFLHPHKG